MNKSYSFLEPEVRDGFYVPSEIKQAWAAELKVLKEIDRICQKHHIPYFVDWGTLLGAVRHKGFIPWDDDIDITMKRKDYQRFLQVAEEEMPEGYSLFTYKTHPDFWSFMGRFVAKNRICFEEEHLRNFYGFPYIVGIDIFVLDYVSKDEEQNKERARLARLLIETADAIAEGRYDKNLITKTLETFEHLFQVQFHSKDNPRVLRIQMYELTEKLFAKFSEEESKELTRMMPNELYRDGNLRLNKEYYDKQLWLPFEDISVPVPCGYDEMLRKRYGDYMRIVRGGSAHDYPFFETQKKQLQAVLDFEMPGYKYSGIASRNINLGSANSLKGKVREIQKQLETNYHYLSSHTSSDLETLKECQELAIEMGNWIEQCKGDNHPIISILEAYCEIVYQLSLQGSEELLAEMQHTLAALNDNIQHTILNRTEAVFIVYKASQWKYIQTVWQAASEDPQCDVYVIPIPYYYKDYDGSFLEEHYEGERFPETVSITAYDEFDFALHYPEMIFIQNPYDEYNPVFSVHRFFYSANLKQYTKRLIYIPPFMLEEFSKNSDREYQNMQYYCTVPGVVNADKVIVQSDNMRQLYVEKLTEFSGDDTRTLWEEKIVGLGCPKDNVDNLQSDNCNNIPQEWLPIIEKPDDTHKKIILYYTDLSSFFQNRYQAISSMKHALETFTKYSADLAVLWKTHPLTKTVLEQLEPDLYQAYCSIEKEFLESTYVISGATISEQQAVSVSDAYYGDSSTFIQKFKDVGKPVMVVR